MFKGSKLTFKGSKLTIKGSRLLMLCENRTYPCQFISIKSLELVLGGPAKKNAFFIKCPPNHFWVSQTTLLGVNMISWKFCWKKLTRTYPLGVSNIETFHANKKSHFACYFEPYSQIPEHMHMGCFKYVKLFQYIVGRCMSNFVTWFQR